MTAPLILAIFLAAAPTGASGDCRLDRIHRCRNTNQLVWSPGFEAAVRRFSGDAKTEHSYDGSRLNRELIEALGGPPDHPIRWRGYYLFAACRAHSCDEKGAAIVSPRGRIEALAMIWYPCAQKWRVEDGCSAKPRLTILIRRPTDSAMVRRLKQWAMIALAEYRDPPPTIERTEVLRRPK